MALARFQATIVDASGNVQAGASVEVRSEVAGQPLVPLFSDRDGLVPIGNPFTADAVTGVAAFHVAGGSYQIVATLGSFSQTLRYVALGTAAELDVDDIQQDFGNNDFSTQAEAAAATIPITQLWLRISGYASAGDGGAALYKRVGSDPLHPGTFQSADGAWWELVNRDVNPEMFGAVGDGITNDATAIQNMANYICRFGGHVSFRQYAEYLINSVITWRPQIAEGNDTHGAYDPPSEILFDLDKRVVHIDLNHARIIAGAVMTNMFHFVSNSAVGINEVAPFFSIVERGVFQGDGNATTAIYAEWCLGLQAHENRIYGVTNGIKLSGYGTHICRHNYIRAFNCFDLEDGGADSTFFKNDTYPVGTGGSSFYIGLGAAGNGNGELDIRENAATGEVTGEVVYFVNVDGTGATTELIRNVSVVNNHIGGMNYLVYGRGTSTTFNLKNFVIRGNHVRDYGTKTTVSLVDATETDNWIIDDNILMPYAVGLRFTVPAIHFVNSARLGIRGNAITHVNEAAMYLQFCPRAEVSGNKLHNIGNSSTQTKVIRITDSTSQALIHHNTIDQDDSSYASSGIVEESSSDSNVAHDNIFKLITTPYVSVGAASRLGEPLWLQCTGQAAVAANVTVYLGQTGANSNEGLVYWQAPSSGRVIALKAAVLGAPGLAETFTYTARKGGSDQSMTCQISGASSFSASDTANHFAVADGDLLTIKLVTSTSAASTGHRVSLMFMGH